jgi:hypothetical protein
VEIVLQDTHKYVKFQSMLRDEGKFLCISVSMCVQYPVHTGREGMFGPKHHSATFTVSFASQLSREWHLYIN